MCQFRSIALAALLGLGTAGFAPGHLANAGPPNSAQADAPAQAKVFAQANHGELSLRPPLDPVATSQDAPPWALTDTGVHIQSRAGFVGYH